MIRDIGFNFVTLQPKFKHMKRFQQYLFALLINALFISCATTSSTSVVSNQVDLSEYKYVVFGNEDEGDAELADILMVVQNAISEKLIVVSPSKATTLISEGEKVLSPKINVKSEKWDGGHTYISVSLYNYETNQSIAVIKSSGIGLTVSHDQKLALKSFIKELQKALP